MTTEDLKSLLTNKSLELVNDDQDAAHGLRLLVTDVETGEVGLLAIEPMRVALPDEMLLDYSYQRIQSPFGRPERLYDIATRVGPDYDPSGVPFLLGEQGGLF